MDYFLAHPQSLCTLSIVDDIPIQKVFIPLHQLIGTCEETGVLRVKFTILIIPFLFYQIEDEDNMRIQKVILEEW